MRILIFFVFIFFNAAVFAQSPLPVIRANSNKARIVEGADDSQNWIINPHIHPDVHTISKIVKPRLIKFYTDIDSVSIKIKPGQQFNFIVLLNNHDSCYTRIESAPVKNYADQLPVTHDTIPFILTPFNNIKLMAVLNGIDTVELKFDSGTTGLLLTDSTIKNKTHVTNPGAASNRLQIGKLVWDSLPIYPVKLSGQGTDGRFGWDLFDGRIVEIDYDKSIFIVHSKMPALSTGYSMLNMEYVHTLFCVRGELQIKQKRYSSRFLFDNGYQRTIMLDTELNNALQYPKDLPVIKKVVMKNGAGREIPVLTVNNERLNLGKHILLNIPAQLLATANPAGFKTHILGNEVLKRFNTILDFQHNIVYLKLNSLAGLPYADAR